MPKTHRKKKNATEDKPGLLDVSSLKTRAPLSDEEKELWRRKSAGDMAARNELVEKYFGIVDANVQNVIKTIMAAIEESDFDQAAMVGFLSAVKEFDVDGDVRFEDFSSLKIRQAILEELHNFIRE